MTPSPSPGRKPLRQYKDLPRGGARSYYRKLVANTPKGAAAKTTFERLAAFTGRIQNWWAWAGHVLKYVLAPRYSPIPSYQAGGGITDLPSAATIAVAGDWGTGTREAGDVMTRMTNPAPDYTIHLGDVYYVGDEPEVRSHFLPGGMTTWLPGSKGAFALIGNHEMYGTGTGGMLGEAFYRDILSYLKQPASFFCLRNDSWIIVGLDTGYYSTGIVSALGFLRRIPGLNKTSWFQPSCRLPDELMTWLQPILADAGMRGVILMSHHQAFSSFEDWYPQPSKQLLPLIGNRPVIWFWGHEHRMALYDPYKVGGTMPVYGRCIGHGGMPVELSTKLDQSSCRCIAYDNRTYLEDISAGYNGYATMTFDGARLAVQYVDSQGTTLLTEKWSVDTATGALQGPDLTRVAPDQDFIFPVPASA